MKNQPTVSGAIHLYLLAFLLVLSLAQAVAAQPANSCSGPQPVLVSGTNINTFTGTAVAGPADDIDMTTCGNGDGVGDVVMCFTPDAPDVSNTCTATITCTMNTGGNVDLGYTSGLACSNTPTCPVANRFSGNPTATTGAIPLTGGVQYCVYCERNSGASAFTLNMAITSDCGALPVELINFSIESSTAEGPHSGHHEPGGVGAVE